MAKGNNEKYKIPDPKLQLEELKKIKSKYNLGANGIPFYEIRELKPTFAFDYLSLKQSNLCFNCEELTTKDFIGFLEGLKKNSFITYNELRTNPYYRFHPIDFEKDKDKISIKMQDFKSVLTFKDELLSDEELPTLYQFDLHYHQKARTCGFLFKGVFYIVWFDKDHIIYPGEK
jgi:hypothetical protein